MAETAGGGSQFSRLDALCLSPTSREIHPEEQNIHPLLNRRDIAGCEINCEADSIGLPAMFFVAAFVSKHQDFAFSLKPINPIILIRVRPMMHLILMIHVDWPQSSLFTFVPLFFGRQKQCLALQDENIVCTDHY